MKKILTAIIISVFALGGTTSAQTQQPVSGVGVSDVSIVRDSNLMTVDMNVDLSDLKIRSNRTVLLTPSLINGTDTLPLYSVGIYGRQRYYYYIRNGKSTLTGATEQSYRDNNMPSQLAYHTTVPYAEWMDGSKLILIRQDYGCCSTLLDEQSTPLGGYDKPAPPTPPTPVIYSPEFRYMRPVAESVKTRALSGSAFIDFPVNRTELYPDYRGNRAELAKIIATIDSVRNDKDITVTRLTIKGFASPEGKYSNNVRLAKGRTETLKQYVQKLYKFAPDFIATDYEPEDWAGLRRYVASSTLGHRDEILGIIDDTMLEPDTKDLRIKQRYPNEYRFLLAEVYPGLRHSDYTIAYTVRSYSDVNEIRAIMATQPHKLSLNEMFLLAQSLEAGSYEYNEVFETAVRMYPDDVAANLNAANAAMGRKDCKSAEKYLQKAGDSAEAVYARGVLAALQGDYDKALTEIENAERLGMKDVDGVKEHLLNVKKYMQELKEYETIIKEQK